MFSIIESFERETTPQTGSDISQRPLLTYSHKNTQMLKFNIIKKITGNNSQISSHGRLSNPNMLNKKFTDPPASDKTLQNLVDNVLKKSFKNLNTTIITFKGAGKGSELKYLLGQHKNIPNYPDKKLFAWLDLQYLKEDDDKVYRDALSYLNTVFHDSLEHTDSLSELLQKKRISHNDFCEFLYNLTFNEDYSITLMLGNFRYAYGNYPQKTSLANKIDTLRQVNPMKISLAFFCEEEFSDSQISDLKGLSLIFRQNFVYGKNVSFDEESAQRLFQNQAKWNKFKFSKNLIRKAVKLSSGDPYVMKFIATKAISDDKFAPKLISAKTIPESYKVIDSQWLNTRYQIIIKCLRKESITCLQKENFKNPTEFLLNTGLIRKEGNIFTVINPLFQHYIESEKHSFDKITILSPKDTTITQRELKKTLTAKELLLLNLLKEEGSNLVTREKIAETMWGDKWEENYSDWAIDKLVSNLRKKLEKLKYPGVIKVLKGKGIMFM